MRKLSLTALLLITACTVGPDYEMPKFELPESWQGQAEKKTEPVETAPVPDVTPEWWKSFNDPVLNDLEAEALEANADIATAASRVAQARANLRITDSYLYPDLSLQAGAVRTDPSGETIGGRLSGGKPYNDFRLSAVLNYEISLWGSLTRASESARAQMLSEEANREAIRLAVASDVATGYFGLRGLDSQIDITKATIKARQVGLEYQQKQFNVGAIDVLTFRRAEAELATAQAALPILVQNRVELQNSLAILLGRSPKTIIEAPLKKQGSIANLPAPPVLPADAPSTLLQRRPDIAAAEQQLIAANAQIGVALADYYPSFSLSSLIGLATADVDRLFRGSAKEWNVGGNAAMPLVDFGRIGGNVDYTKAQKREALINYQQVVRLAFADVSNALSRIKTSQGRLDAQTTQVRANQETYRVAQLRYESGYATQLDLLDAQRQLFQSQIDQIDAMQQRLAATVTLQKALGGGWTAPVEKH